MKVNDTDPRVNRMAEDWALIDALMGGTREMRQAGKRHLPRFELEDERDYQTRLSMATLFPALANTIAELTSRAFAEPVELKKDDVPAWIRSEVWPDINMQGQNGHAWAREWFADALEYGLSHALVEAPVTAGVVRTQAEQKEANARPYVIEISPERILGWKSQGGVLTQVRITWSRVEESEFGQAKVPQIRVYDNQDGVVSVRTFEEVGEVGKKEWVQVGPATVLDLPIIPLVTAYTKRDGLLEACPPLLELAQLNRKHWIKQSSNDALIETASIPVLAVIGVDDTFKLAVGAKTAVSLPVGADMKFVEHSGKAIAAGRESLADLEAQMKAIGAKLIEPGSGTKTATQAGEEAAQSNSALGDMVESFQDALEQLLYVFALYRGEDKGGTVEMKPNLDPDHAPVETMGVLGQMVAKGALSKSTWFEEGKRRGMISEEVDWEDEQARIQTDPPVEAQPVKVGAK